MVVLLVLEAMGNRVRSVGVRSANANFRQLAALNGKNQKSLQVLCGRADLLVVTCNGTANSSEFYG